MQKATQLILKHVTSWSKKTRSELVGIIAVIGVLTTLVYQLPDTNKLVRWYQATLFRKAYFSSSLVQLKAGQSIDSVVDIFGTPIIRRDIEIEGTHYGEHIFIDPFFYLQAIVDGGGQVVLYTFTTRDKSFNPTVTLPTGEFITLGKTKFSELHLLGEGVLPEALVDTNPRFNMDSGYQLYIGVHDFNYYERYWLGNPGGYQTFFFGTHELGEPSPSYSEVDLFKLPNPSVTTIALFRQETTITTYGETAVFESIDLPDPENLGVHKNDVRIFSH